MEGSPRITVPHQESDAATFKPVTKLPDHLNSLGILSKEVREQADAMLKKATEYTDLAALRSAALPQSE